MRRIKNSLIIEVVIVKGIIMEIYELPITSEESRNYHRFIYRLKVLSAVDWVKAYIMTVIYTIVLCAVFYMLSGEYALVVWNYVDMPYKILIFIILLVLSALQRSRNMQLNAMLQKYLINNLPQEFLSGKIRLTKIKVVKDKIVVYYRKLYEQ